MIVTFNRVLLALLLVVWSFESNDSLAQQTTVNELAPLSADENAAMDAVTLRTVTGCIAFLASDELAGRATPSVGLQTAAAYVAARFQGAGLTGMGDNGSFHQMAAIELVQTPSGGIVLSRQQKMIAHLGLLNAGQAPLEFRGEIPEIDLTGSQAASFSGPVVTTLSRSGNLNRAMSSLARHCRKLAGQGATAILVRVEAEDPLIAEAIMNRSKPRSMRRRQIALPVLLVAKQADLNGNINITLPAALKVEQKVSNVIGMIRGSDPELSQEAIIFSAHLDHLGSRDNTTGDPIYNGADDNASGVTGVLSLADAFGTLEAAPRRTVIFVAFWGEESGLLGSRYLVQNPLWPLDKTVANINLEMIGRPESGAQKKAWMTGWEQSDLGALMARGARRVEIEIFEHPRFSPMLYRASDNWPFVQAGVIAHSFSAGSLHDDYHQPGDEWEKLDLKHMREVIRGLFAGALPIANGELTPARSPQGRDR